MVRFVDPRRLRSNGVVLAGLLFTVTLLAVPVVTVNQYTLYFVSTVALFSTFAMTWDFFSGLTGYINFGHTVLLGIAGYSSALINYELGLPIAASILLATLVTGFLGVTIIAAPSLRLTGVYFVTFTLILPLVAQKLVVLFSNVTGGVAGFTFLQPLGSAFQGMSGIAPTYILQYYFTVGTFLGSLGLLVVLTKSELGNILRGVHQDELLLSTLGIDPKRFKIVGFGITSVLTGFSAAVWTHFQLSLAPSSHLSLTLMIDIIVAAIIGGLGTIVGPAIGMMLLLGFQELLSTLETMPLVAETLGIELTEYRMITTMFIALGFFYYYPSGVYPPIRRRIESLAGRLQTGESVKSEAVEGENDD